MQGCQPFTELPPHGRVDVLLLFGLCTLRGTSGSLTGDIDVGVQWCLHSHAWEFDAVLIDVELVYTKSAVVANVI